MEKNAFNIITQVSSTVSIFKQQPWGEMDIKHKSYALNQLAHSASGLFADLTGFNPAEIPKITAN